MKGSPSDMYARYLSFVLLPRDRDWGRILSYIALFFTFYNYRTRLYLAFPSHAISLNPHSGFVYYPIP